MYKLSPINNWEIFEELCLALWNNILDKHTVKKFGRRGQKQKGLDITAKFNNEIIGIQCKCVNELNIDDIDKELKKLEELDIELKEYIIATTYFSDATLDEYIMKKSQDNDYPFEITIYFWNDIVDELFKEENLNLIKDYYPEYVYDDSQMSKILNYGINQFNEGNYKSVEECLETINNSIDDFSRKNKYELSILEGKYLELCRKYEVAGEKYIESYEFSSKDIQSKYYYALGLCYISKFNESKQVCNEILTEEPLNKQVYSLLILIDKYDCEIPQELLDCSEINYNLGLISYSNKEYDKSYKFFKKSKSDTPIKLLYCAINRATLICKSSEFPLNISSEDLKKLVIIENMLQEIFDGFSDNILSYYLDVIPNLLSLNYFNHNFNLLNHNVERILNIDSENKVALYYKAVLFKERGLDDEALKILKEIPCISNSFLLITEILIKQENYQDIIEFGEHIINSFEVDSEQYLICHECLFNIYIELGEYDKAKNLLKDVKNNFRRNLYKSQLCSDNSKKLDFLLQCYNNMDEAFCIDKINLAIQFRELGHYDKAISIYESSINIKSYSQLIDDLAFCYLKNKDYSKLIHLCDYHINNKKPPKHLIECAIDVYLEIHDFKSAINLMKIYSDNFELNNAMRIAKAQIQLFNKEYDKVNDFLNKCPDFKLLTLDECLKIYGLYKLMSYDSYELFEILFKIREIHSNDLSIHEVYVDEFLNKSIEFNDPSKVTYDVGILLNFDNVPYLAYVSEDNNDIYTFNQFDLIMGYEKGKIIKLENNIKLEILNIYHKFNYAFLESMKFIKLNNSKFLHFINSNSEEESIEKIKEYTLNRHNYLNDLKKYYSENFCPLMMFSKKSGLDLYDSHILLKEYGLKSFSVDENVHCPIQQKLVLDFSSLMTIHILNIENLILENYSTCISTSEYLLLKEMQHKTRLNLNQENMVCVISNGNFQVSNRDYKDKYDFLSNIIGWIDENCEIIKSNALFELNREEKSNLDKIPFQNIKENILLAFGDCMYVSDDLDLKLLINKLFNVKTCGILTIIFDLLFKGIINQNDFENLILDLFELKFQNLKITTQMIIKVLSQKKYNLFIKFLLDYSINPYKYSNIDWNMIIKNMDTNNLNEKILFEMINKTLLNFIFIRCCKPLLVKQLYSNKEIYIASRFSKKFHKEDCVFAKKISIENIVKFSSKKEALENGYVACSKCMDKI